MRLGTISIAALASSLMLLACGDDDNKNDNNNNNDVSDSSGEDASLVDDTSEADTSDTLESDADDEDGFTDSDAAELCEHSCVNEFGNNDRKLCPSPASDWRCQAGCCLAIFKCESNQDCAEKGVEEGHCEDDGSACLCNLEESEHILEGSLPEGRCYNWHCAVDSQCGDGEVCAAGLCVANPGTDGLDVRILDRQAVYAPGQNVALHGELFSVDGSIVLPLSESAVWESSDEDIATVDENGLVTFGEKEGAVTLTLHFGEESDSLVLENVAKIENDVLTLVVRTELTWEPVEGVLYLEDQGGQSYIQDLPLDGIVRVSRGDFDPEGPFSLTVFAAENDWITWLQVEPESSLYLPIPKTAYSRLKLDQAGALEDDSSMRNVAIIRGEPDFSDYTYDGEMELAVTSTALSSALFDFSLPVLLGAEVKRYLHPDSNMPGIDKTEVLDVPGGITFNLAGPAVPDFLLTAPKGRQDLWTLGGRVTLSEASQYISVIVDAIKGGDLDLTLIVGAIFPLFKNFASAYTPGLLLDEVDNLEAATEVSPKLSARMTQGSLVDVPRLPSFGLLEGEEGPEFFADAVFLLAGAETVDSFMIPLGLNGGADTSNPTHNPPDGYADAIENTPEKDPFLLPFASLHTGLQGPFTSYLVAAVAASIPAGGSDPRPSAGSAVLAHYAPGEAPDLDLQLQDFLGFPEEAGSVFLDRAVQSSDVADADVLRVLIKGRDGAHWTVYGLSPDRVVVLPSPEDLELSYEDRFTSANAESILINALEFVEGVPFEELGEIGSVGIDRLLNLVKRVSFIDVKGQALPQ